jgi:hypothetical protein
LWKPGFTTKLLIVFNCVVFSYFVCLRPVSCVPLLPVTLDCPLVIAPSVFYNVHLPLNTNRIACFIYCRTGFELTILVVIDTECTGSCKSKYHTITTKTTPWYIQAFLNHQISGDGVLAYKMTFCYVWTVFLFKW